MEKERYILINGKKIPVTKEIYYAYKRYEWRESKQAKARAHRESSYDFMVENGFEGQIYSGQALVDEIVADKLLLDTLLLALTELTNDERFLIDELFYKENTERAVAEKVQISHQAVHRRKIGILKKLKKLLNL